MSRTLCRIPFWLSIVSCAGVCVAHESPVDHVGRELRMWWADGRLHVSYRLILTERAALLQLNAIDRDRDGTISDAERAAFFSSLAKNLAGRFVLTIDAKPVALHPEGEVVLDPAMGQTFTFITDALPLPPGKHPAQLLDYYSRAYPGPYRMIPADCAAGAEIEVIAATQGPATETHPGMVIVPFRLTITGK